jgi:uncharacterized SAM-binding protein YcdF (DUF218 family)
VKRGRRAIKFAAAGVAVAALSWLGGLAWFVHSSLWIAVDSAMPTDAIVVLTGGRLRVETALDLLGAGRAQKLFISGVNPRVDRGELLRAEGWTGGDDPGRIALGREAENTFGNARETADWMHQEGYRSLRLVTSWYHMRRSLLEFERAMPDTLIVAEPVFAGHSESEPWSGWFGIAMVTIGEYDKFLAAFLRPEATALWRAAQPGQAAQSVERSTADAADRPR